MQPLPPADNFAPGQSARINSVAVNGSSVYPQADLSALTQGLTGPAVPLQQVEQARRDLLARYRRDGFLLTTVSSALDAKGNLRFVVVEGYIADVKLEGDIGPAGTQVLRFLHRLLDERPIRIATLERYLLLASDVPGVTLRSVLRPAIDDPSAVTLVAVVSRKAVDGLLAADNRSFRGTGPETFLALGAFNSFTQFGERTELSILHSFDGTQIFGQAATEFFVGSSGLKVRLYGGAGDTSPSGILVAPGYNGTTQVFGTQISYPVIRSRQQTLLAIGVFDALESDISTATGVDGSAARASFDSVRVVRVGADYVLQDLLLGGDRVGTNNVTFRLSQGLDWLGATKRDNPLPGRPGENPGFFKFNAELSRNQTLFEPWENASVSLYGQLSGQVTNTVLPPSEEFFLGGLRYNRGFYAGEVTGDNGLSGSVELRLNTGFPLTGFGHSINVDAQFYLFQDWGETWENQPQDENHTLRSTGLGVRSQLSQYLTLELEGVNRETRNPASSSGTKPLKEDAVYWRVVTRF